MAGKFHDFEKEREKETPLFEGKEREKERQRIPDSQDLSSFSSFERDSLLADSGRPSWQSWCRRGHNRLGHVSHRLERGRGGPQVASVSAKDSCLGFDPVGASIRENLRDHSGPEAPGSLGHVLHMNTLTQNQGLERAALRGLDHLVPVRAPGRLEAVSVELVRPGRRQFRPQTPSVEGFSRGEAV